MKIALRPLNFSLSWPILQSASDNREALSGMNIAGCRRLTVALALPH
jgi:hypothetical protein